MKPHEFKQTQLSIKACRVSLATATGASESRESQKPDAKAQQLVEEKVQVDEESKHLLRSSEWLKLCDRSDKEVKYLS